eukprot:c23867_g1_i1 orf=186-2084(+)
MERPQSGNKGPMMLKSIRARSMPKLDKPVFDVLPDESPDQQSVDGTSSTTSFDRFCADILGEGSVLGSPRDTFWDGEESTTSNSVESSPLGWPRSSKSRLGKLHSLPKFIDSREASGWAVERRDVFTWTQRRDASGWVEGKDTSGWEKKKEEKAEDYVSEADLIKERFAKLLLGEDLSGGGKGVSSALAISNAITNLSASIFGEVWRLEPMAEERKARWRREMGWLLSVSDHIVEFVPSVQALPNGTTTEVMVTKPRSDIHMNLPALRKLDTMLLETLDGFDDTEFWYVDRAVAMAEKDGVLPFRQEEKWWLPIPRVPAEGLSVEGRRHLQHQRDSVNQILKAALAINAQVLSEMEVPLLYWEALPKNGRSSLGEALYRMICSEHFSPDQLIASIDSIHEHNVLELVNRVEAAMHIWRRKLQIRHVKDGRATSKSSWGLAKDGGATDLEKRELLSERAESLLMLLRQKFPGLPQTILDMNKIQYNKDVGQSILESYSRVLESLAFNVLSKINDVLHVDDVIKCNQQHAILSRKPSTNRDAVPKAHSQLPPKGPQGHYSSLPKSASTHAMHATSPPASYQSKPLSEFIEWSAKTPNTETKELEHYGSAPWAGSNKPWSYSGSVNALRSPPSRD